MNKLSSLLLSTLLLSACDEAPAELVCADGEVACATGVCVGADDLCPTDPLAAVPADPLAGYRADYGLGGGVCGGEALDADGLSARWSIVHQPGVLRLEIDLQADGDVDESFEQHFASPTRLTRAVQQRDGESAVEHIWDYKVDGRLGSFHSHDGVAPVLTEWRYFFDRIERRAADEIHVARFDAERRIDHVEAFVTGERDAYQTTEYRYGEHGLREIRFDGDFRGTLPVVTDELGRVLEVGREGLFARYERDELGRVTAEHTDAFGEKSTRRFFYDCE